MRVRCERLALHSGRRAEVVSDAACEAVALCVEICCFASAAHAVAPPSFMVENGTATFGPMWGGYVAQDKRVAAMPFARRIIAAVNNSAAVVGMNLCLELMLGFAL